VVDEESADVYVGGFGLSELLPDFEVVEGARRG
jgi:hypothetical protein